MLTADSESKFLRPFQWALSFQGFWGLVDLSHFSFCVFVCVHMCVCLHVHVCVKEHMEVRGIFFSNFVSSVYSVSSSVVYHLLLWDIVSHCLWSSLFHLDQPNEAQRSAFLHFTPSPSAGVTGFYCYIWLLSVGAMLWKASISPDWTFFFVFYIQSPHSFSISCFGFRHFCLGTPFLCSVVLPVPSQGIWDAKETFWAIVVHRERIMSVENPGISSQAEQRMV